MLNFRRSGFGNAGDMRAGGGAFQGRQCGKVGHIAGGKERRPGGIGPQDACAVRRPEPGSPFVGDKLDQIILGSQFQE
ncbi:hypothetical protein ACFQEX_06370 [Roseibium salinum]|uniref:hypothetical protein n=1 Tax=Roseibium salinum TaxID=1604349 RepID=UPI00360B7EE9